MARRRVGARRSAGQRRQEEAQALADALDVSWNGEEVEAAIVALARLLVALLKGLERGPDRRGTPRPPW